MKHSPMNHLRALAAFVAALVTLAVAPGRALAEGKLAIDVEANLPDDTPRVGNGWGAGLRLGNTWDLWLIELTPELGASYHSFGGSAGATAYRALAGGRLALGLILQPSVFVHAGVGHFSYDAYENDVSETDLAYDAGAALDFTLLPWIDLGAHVSLNRINAASPTESLSWVAAGGHIAISLGD